MKKAQQEAIENLAQSLKCGLFYTAPTFEEGVSAAQRMQEACGPDKVGAMTAMGILNNSVAQELKRILDITE